MSDGDLDASEPWRREASVRKFKEVAARERRKVRLKLIFVSVPAGMVVAGIVVIVLLNIGSFAIHMLGRFFK